MGLKRSLRAALGLHPLLHADSGGRMGRMGCRASRAAASQGQRRPDGVAGAFATATGRAARRVRPALCSARRSTEPVVGGALPQDLLVGVRTLYGVPLPKPPPTLGGFVCPDRRCTSRSCARSTRRRKVPILGHMGHSLAGDRSAPVPCGPFAFALLCPYSAQFTVGLDSHSTHAH